MQIEDLDEPIAVRADFTAGAIKPRLFRRGTRTYEITGLNAQWVDRDGHNANYHFSVQSGEETYFICLRGDDFSWHLEKVVSD
jgi:hypothetical protein